MKDGIKLFGRTEYMTSVIFDGNIDCIGKIVQIEIIVVIKIAYLVN